MASKTIDEFLKSASAKQIAEVQATGQGLQRTGLKNNTREGFEAMPPTDPANAQAKEGKLGAIAPNETAPDKSQRGAHLIQQKMAESEKNKAVDHAKDVVKDKAPEKAPEPER